MTAVQDRPGVVDHRADAVDPPAATPPARRVIAVGVRNHEHDQAPLQWAVTEAGARGDTLHVVHSYLPVHLEGCTWEPVQRARDARYVAGRRAVAQAIQRVHAASPVLTVDGSTVAGLPVDVLDELSVFVDLLVVGDDSGAPAGRVSRTRTTWWVQDVARCPVVAVPPGRPVRPDRPVTVVLGEHGSAATVEYAAEWARRHRTMLRISQPDDGVSADDPEGLAASQEDLDIQACHWQARYPGLGVIARIERDPQWLTAVAARSSVVVVASRDADLVRHPGVALRCPTVTVPDRVTVADRPPAAPAP